MYKWIKLSADQKYPATIWVLSTLYTLGVGVGKDNKKADELILKASELGCSNATMHLAKSFEKSGGLEKAIEMYTRAQSQGEKTDYSIRRLKRKLGI